MKAYLIDPHIQCDFGAFVIAESERRAIDIYVKKHNIRFSDEIDSIEAILITDDTSKECISMEIME